MMDIQFYGANCIVLTTKHARVVVDDNLVDLGRKSITKAGDIALFTGAHGDPAQPVKIVVDQPGEYEVSGVSIYGIAARAHIDEEKQKTVSMYKIIIDDLRILVTGHVYPELSDAQLETIGMVDVLFVPVGGNGYTLDPIGALKLIKAIEPKLIIPTHYDSSAIKYPVPQQELEQALKALAMEPKETIAKLKVKAGELGDIAQLTVLEQQ
jgi:L-ascorbate metabolism protein UlaG (beta-lactamase superfamily)